MIRYFFRCFECLSVSAIDSIERLGYDFKAICGACKDSRPIEFMGQVKRDHLIKEELRCPCDGRCTSATGPQCDCKCSGKNHGSNALVIVEIDAGPIPVITPRAPIAARMRVKEFRDAFAAAENRLPGRAERDRKAAGERLNAADFETYLRYRDARARLRRIEQMKSHPARMKALRELTRTAPPSPTQTALFSGGTHV